MVEKDEFLTELLRFLREWGVRVEQPTGLIDCGDDSYVVPGEFVLEAAQFTLTGGELEDAQGRVDVWLLL